MNYIIHIPNWHPTKLNKLMGNGFAASRKKAGDMCMISAYCQKVPKATGKRRVDMTITLGKGQRGGDPDAYFKSTNDALVRLGLLKDDNRQWLQLEPIMYERAERPATTIVLRDI